MAMGVVLLFYGYWTNKIVINGFDGFKTLTLIFVLLFLSVLFSTGGDYAWSKLVNTIVHGIFSYVGFIVLFSNINKVKQLYGLYPIVYAFLLLRLSIIANEIPGPSNFFDLGFLRLQTTISLGSDEDAAGISYHSIGYYCLQGIALLLIKDKIKGTTASLLLVISMIACLYSGARQTIVVAALVVFLYFAFLSNRKTAGFLLISAVLAIVAYFVSTSEFFETSFGLVRDYGYLEGSNRDGFMEKGVKDFIENPLFGVGYGRFYINGGYGSYPHNMIVELLAELGIIGTTIMGILLLHGVIKTRECMKKYLIYFVILFMQAMVSRGMDTNIVVFSFVLVCPILMNSHRTTCAKINQSCV